MIEYQSNKFTIMQFLKNSERANNTTNIVGIDSENF